VQGNRNKVTINPIKNADLGEVIFPIIFFTFGLIKIGISVPKLPAL